MNSFYKYLICIQLVLLSGLPGFCQKAVVKQIEPNATAIDTSLTLTSAEKLSRLRLLKKTFETAKQTVDTGYVITLIKLARYEYFLNHDLALSIQYSTTALDLNARCRPSISKRTKVNCLYNLAYYYNDGQQFTNALSYYDSVLHLCKDERFDDYVITARYDKAQIYFSLGDYQKAADESTVGIAESVASKDSSYYASFLNFRAYSSFFQNDFTRSLADADTATVIAKKTSSLFDLAESYEVKGLTYQKQEKNDLAEQFLKLAIATRKDSSAWYYTNAIDLINLGILYSTDENRFSEAKSLFRKAIEFGLLCDDAKRIQALFLSYTRLAMVAAKEQRFLDAGNYYTLAGKSAGFTKNDLLSPVYSSQFSTVAYREIIFTYLFGKTELLLQQYSKTHNTVYLKACLQTAKITDTLITKTRQETLGENSKLFWRNESRSFFSTAIEACYDLNDVPDAYYFIEKSRAVLLNDTWNEQKATTFLPAIENAQQEVLKIKIIELQLQLSATTPNTNEYTKVENRLLQAREELEHFIAKLEKQYPQYKQHKYFDEVPPLATLQTYLTKSRQSFVYYFLGEDALYALYITPKKNTFLKVAKTDFDSRQLFNYARLCGDKQKQNRDYKAFLALSNQIYKKLFQPLQISKGSVAICTDNFFIPFEALHKTEKEKDILLYDYQFNYVYSARALLKPFSFRKPIGNFVGYAPVSYAAHLQVVDLKQSAEALENMASFYNLEQVFTNEQATRQNFFSNAPRYSMVTIFSHAKADTSGQEPVLYMCDSLIHLSELQKLTAPATQFVLLSACQTNTGKNATGEGIYSLARGFASIGVPAVSATLWNADEQATYLISTKFSEYLSQGMNKAKALQKAKIWYLENNEDGEHSLPYYWANMVLIGSSQPIGLPTGHSFMAWLSLSIVCATAVMAGFYFIYALRWKTKRFTS